MSGIVVAALADLPSVPTTEEGDADWKPIAHYASLSAFGANAFVAAAVGEELVGPHDESGSGQEELYVVVRGSASFDLDGAEHVVAAPGFVAITDPSVPRSAVAASADAILLAVGRSPVGMFASTWDERHTRDVPRYSSQ